VEDPRSSPTDHAFIPTEWINTESPTRKMAGLSRRPPPAGGQGRNLLELAADWIDRYGAAAGARVNSLPLQLMELN